MPDWATIAGLATALGTLVLALATYAAVRSANRTARIAEQSLLENIRPLLLPSRVQDAGEKIGFQDDHWLRVAGGHAGAEATDEAVYLGVPLRNVGSGLAVLNSWLAYPGRDVTSVDRPDSRAFRRLTRDLYVAARDLGFWQGAIRDPDDPLFGRLGACIRDHTMLTVDVLYSDADGGQRVITRIVFLPVGDSDWLASIARHWHLDRPGPR